MPTAPSAVLGPDQAARGRADRVHRAGRHVPGRARAAAAAARRCSACSASGWRRPRRGGDQPPDRPAHRRVDGAHRAPAAGHRRADAGAGAGVRGVPGRAVDDDPDRAGQSADRGADLRLADRLRDRLHRLPQARDAAEHRHRRHRRRRAAAAGLGRGHRHARRVGLAARAAAGADHLRVDAAAFLGAGDLPPRRLRARAGADAAGDARRATTRAGRSCSTPCCWWR